MTESVMRQGLKTWLKAECQQVGMDMLFAVFAADTAQLDAARLINPALQLTAAQDVENLIRNAVSHMTNLPLSLLTAEERRKVFDLQEEIEALLKEVRRPGIHERPGLLQAVNDKIYDINIILRQYLLEKVVECQCGKPPISPAKWEIIIPTDIEALFAKGIITDDERSYLLLELHKGPFTIQEGIITR